MTLKQILDQYVVDGWLKRCERDGLYLYNYTAECQFAARWDYYTRMARGLIIDNDSNIIARPLSKFFNFNEQPETQFLNLPKDEPEVSDKVDGSMVTLFKHNGAYQMATRGVFDSPQAVEATKIFNANYAAALPLIDAYEDFTFVFEVIYPENRIVVDYKGMRDIILLAVVHKKGGWDHTYAEVNKIATTLGFKSVHSEMLTFDQVWEKVEQGQDNFEGYVLRFANGLRVKMKMEEYVRLHRMLTGISEWDIWDMLKNKRDETPFVTNLPEEFKGWYESAKGNFVMQYNNLLTEAKAIYDGRPDTVSRKEVALYIQDKTKDNKIVGSICFALYKGSTQLFIDNMIWKHLEPNAIPKFKLNQT